MKSILSTSLFALLSCTLYSQENEAWYTFRDANDALTGFKDSLDNIRIEPRFVGITSGTRFRHIIAVAELIDGEYTGYYLLKNGKKIGKDSLFTWDNAFDCEQEGFIRFRDPVTDQVGFFNIHGKVAIPAEYNEASQFRNGLSVVLKGAEKNYPYAHDTIPDEYYVWEGGVTCIIDTLNRVLVENPEYQGPLDWHSLQVQDNASDDPARVSYLGTDGKYYTFVHHKRAFEAWFHSEFLGKPDRETLVKHTYTGQVYVSYRKDREASGFTTGSGLIREKFDILHTAFSNIREKRIEYTISVSHFNPFIFEQREFDKYFDDCRNAKSEEYPFINVVLSYRSAVTGAYLYQDHFGFLKTENGYKLINVAFGADTEGSENREE